MKQKVDKPHKFGILLEKNNNKAYYAHRPQHDDLASLNHRLGGGSTDGHWFGRLNGGYDESG